MPAALSWACGPNRAIQLDKNEYPPNGTVTVTGANFEVGASVEVTVNSEPVASGTASSVGNIAISFPAPSTPGTYTVATRGVDQQGQALAGTGGVQSLVVVAPRSTTPAPTTGGNTGSTGGNRTPAPGTSPGAQPGGTQQQSGSNSTSGRERSGSGARERSGTTRGSAPSGSGVTSPGVNTNEGVIETAGTTAFAGSVTRQDRVAATKAKTTKKGKAIAPATARPERGTASGDLWSGFASPRNPSLLSGGSAVSGGGTSGGAVLGLALLGLGALAALGLGGFAIAGRRKSRAQAQ